MNLLYGPAGEVVAAEMTPAAYAWRSASSKSHIDGVAHVSVWCVVGQRVDVPVRFLAPVELAAQAPTAADQAAA